jgi:hypothetical protein
MIFKAIACYIFLILLLPGCTDNNLGRNTHKVYIIKEKGRYSLYRLGKPFIIKGAAGYTNLGELHADGGNAIRVWDTTNLETILLAANKNHLAVIVGLPMPESNYMAYYDDTAKVASQYSAFKKLVNKYKNNPAILMWCAGNELTFPYGLSFGNFYKAFNHIVQMIHQDDPDHPVTTTIINFQPKDIFNIQLRTDIDLISFNMFGRLSYLRSDLKKFWWLWRGPYMITEWGINGPWPGTGQTAWGAYIESASTNKAIQYLQRYQYQMPVEDSRFLGSFVFYWGQKQETTHTWYSMFDENGAKTGSVASLKYLWTGTWPATKAPQINYMLLDGKKANDNLLYKPNTKINVQILLLQPDTGITSVKWQIFPEDWIKKNNLNNTAKPNELKGLIQYSNNTRATFITPVHQGPYRIFATIYDRHGNMATCNTPFYVLADRK